MSEIDWNLAPEGADSLKQAFSNNGNLQWFKGLDVYIGDGKYADTVSSRWKTIATRPQTKTVADAYEWNNQSVYAKEQEGKQEGEKWTHKNPPPVGAKCKYALGESDTWWDCEIISHKRLVIHCPHIESDEHCGLQIVGEIQPVRFKAIKPTLTKEQRDFLCSFSKEVDNKAVTIEVVEYLSKHDIT